MKIIYVLVCEKESYLIEQLLLSLYSLKRYNDNEVFIISDRLTSNIIADTLCMQYITDIIVVDVPNEFDTVNRSRFIKTNLDAFQILFAKLRLASTPGAPTILFTSGLGFLPFSTGGS